MPHDHRPLSFGLLLFPELTQLDLTGPYEVFARVPGAKVHLLWKTRDPVAADRGLAILPTTTLDDCPPLDVMCVPGGGGQIDRMDDDAVLSFLREQARRGALMTSVCAGSLVLAAAGLLRGYRATCHWSSLDQLSLLGALPVSERVVEDRDRVTGAGVTSGIDFALTVVSRLCGEAVAREIQLTMEYDPDPPFDSGSPASASPELVSDTRRRIGSFLDRRRAATERVAARWKAESGPAS